MTFIATIPLSKVDEDVRAMYARQQRHYGYVPAYAHVFCYRPEIMGLWAQLQAGIKRHVDPRRYELVTFAAASALRSTLCSLAHGAALNEFLAVEDVQAIARGETPPSLPAAEASMIEFARKVARDASSTTAADIERLKTHGVTDAEIFDLAAIAAARAFWTKLIESLGVHADAPGRNPDGAFVDALTVGRRAEFVEPQRLVAETD